MLKVKRGKGYQVVAFPDYRFYIRDYGICVYDDKGKCIGEFVTEAEAIEYLKGSLGEPGMET